MTTKSVQPTEYKGHTYFPQANSLTPYEEGLYFYMVTLTFSDASGRSGSYETHGLMVPRDRSQYGQIVTDTLQFVRENGPGRSGTKVVVFFDIRPHGLYRDPEALAQEQSRT